LITKHFERLSLNKVLRSSQLNYVRLVERETMTRPEIGMTYYNS